MKLIAHKSIPATSQEVLITSHEKISRIILCQPTTEFDNANTLAIQSIPKSGKITQILPTLTFGTLKQLTDLENNAATLAGTNSALTFISIEIGNIEQDNGDKIEITIKNNHATLPRIVSVYSDDADITNVHRVKKYVLSTLTDQTFDDIETIYLMRTTEAIFEPQTTAGNSTVEIVSNGITEPTDIRGLVIKNVLDSQVIDISAGLKILKMYENTDNIPDDVTIRITESGFKIMAVQFETDVEKQSKMNIKQVQKVHQKVTKMEQAKPEKARALRRAGLVLDSKKYQVMLNSANIGK